MPTTSHHGTADEQALQHTVRERTSHLLTTAGAWLRIAIPEPQILFDLRGRAAGQARLALRGPCIIRFNPVLLRANRASFLADTVPHEVAHLAAFARYGLRIRPHGPEWQAIMRYFGVKPERCHRYDLSATSGRTLREFDYHCDCREHRLSSIRHNRVLAGGTYVCRHCATPLRPGPRPGLAGTC